MLLWVPVAAVGLLYARRKLSRITRMLRGVRSAPGSLPLLGNITLAPVRDHIWNQWNMQDLN